MEAINERFITKLKEENAILNRIVHDYGHVDLGIVYDTLANDVSDIKKFIKDTIYTVE